MKCTRADLVTQPGSGFGGTPKNADAPYRPVKTVNETEIDISRFAVFLLYIRLCFAQQIQVAGRILLHRLVSRFFNDQEMVVFIKNADHSG